MSHSTVWHTRCTTLFCRTRKHTLLLLPLQMFSFAHSIFIYTSLAVTSLPVVVVVVVVNERQSEGRHCFLANTAYSLLLSLCLFVCDFVTGLSRRQCFYPLGSVCVCGCLLGDLLFALGGIDVNGSVPLCAWRKLLSCFALISFNLLAKKAAVSCSLPLMLLMAVVVVVVMLQSLQLFLPELNVTWHCFFASLHQD